MVLEDFLGKTPEINIIDFLAENGDLSYTAIEISGYTGLSKEIIDQKIPEMIQNNILEIKEEKGMKKYQLADNDIVKMLVTASFRHSFKQAEIH